MAKTAFTKLRLLTLSNMDLGLRNKLIKSYIHSIDLYRTETWTLMKMEKKFLENFKIWYCRRQTKINWTDMVTNEEILRGLDEKRSILKGLRRKTNRIEHKVTRNFCCMLLSKESWRELRVLGEEGSSW